MGAACLSDHARESYGRTSHWVRDLAAIGRGLERLPGLAAAIAGHDIVVADDAGGTGPRPIGRTLAARVARVATPDSFDAWLVLARQSAARAFAEAVRAARAAGAEFPPTAPDVASGSAVDGGGITDGESSAGNGATGAGNGTPGNAEPDDDDEAADRKEVCLAVPGGVRLVFDEVLDLHRAVCGGPVPVSDLVEALNAEASNGVEPADVDAAAEFNGLDCFGLRRGPSRAEVEGRLAGMAGGWSFLDRARTFPPGRDPLRRSRADRVLDDTCGRLVSAAHATCERLESVARHAGRGGRTGSADPGTDDPRRRDRTRHRRTAGLDQQLPRLLGEPVQRRRPLRRGTPRHEPARRPAAGARRSPAQTIPGAAAGLPVR